MRIRKPLRQAGGLGGITGYPLVIGKVFSNPSAESCPFSGGERPYLAGPAPPGASLPSSSLSVW